MGKIIVLNRKEDNYIALSYKEIVHLISRFIESISNIKETEDNQDIEELNKVRYILDDIYCDLKIGVNENNIYQISEENLTTIKDFIHKHK